MYSVEVLNGCRCFIRDGLPEKQEFSSEEEAKNEATSLLNHMQKNFCKKHDFELTQEFSSYKIYIKPRK